VQLFAAGYTLDGGDLLLTNSRGLGDARALGLSIDENCASAALAFSAPILGAGQVQMLAQGS
jgi:hypothetical protein